MAHDPPPPAGADDRLARLTRIVDATIDRRLAGADLSDETVIEEHPELMPELAERLRDLRRIEQAAREADRSPAPGRPPGNEAGSPDWIGQLPPVDSFRGYRIVREIESGGQGIVYEAIQESTQRRVAIKVVREGPFGTSRGKGRFEREVQILAALNHPNIVTVHDSGAAAGCFYFVMDYIAGQPLDEYVRSHLVPSGASVPADTGSLRELVRLFAQACHAVNVAHLRGVIHRDLKPGNIRVDLAGEPHILDFGLAKAAEYDVLGASGSDALTQTGQIVGSLPWASPEQAEGRPDQIDIRTDVYSLGVILYQVLTGRFPYDVTGNLRDRVDAILRADPLRPSAICRLIDDELETIVLKCLSKERTRRYQTAGELARDLDRYLVGEAVEAKRASTLYVLRKQLRRHRGPLIVAATFLVLLTGFSAGVTALYVQSRAHLARALSAEAVAEQRARTAQHVSASLETLIRSLDPTEKSDLGISRDRTVSVVELLDECAEQIDTQLAGDPLAQARLMDVLGNVFRSQYQPGRALPLIARALAIRRRELRPHHPDVAQSLVSLARLEAQQRRLDEAQRLCDEALAIFEHAAGPIPEDVELALSYLSARYEAARRFDQADRLARKVVALKRERLGDDNPDFARALTEFGNWLKFKGDLADAEAAHREAVAILRRTRGGEDAATLEALYHLGSLLYYRGAYAEALEIYRRLYPLYARERGAEDLKTLKVHQNIGLMLGALGRYPEALSLFEENHRRKGATLGEENPATMQAAGDWAKVLRARGDLVAAEAKARVALAAAQQETGRTREMSVGWAWYNLAGVHLDRGASDLAEAAARECVGHHCAWAPEDNYHVGLGKSLLGECLLRQGCLDEAEPLLVEGLAVIARTFGPDDERTRTARRRLEALAAARPAPAGE